MMPLPPFRRVAKSAPRLVNLITIISTIPTPMTPATVQLTLAVLVTSVLQMSRPRTAPK
jgi:hypothetical protein